MFHLSITSLVKKYLVLSRLTVCPLSFRLFPLVCKTGDRVNRLFMFTLLNPLRNLKHLISFPLRRRFLRENIFSSWSLSSYDFCRRAGISLVALRCTD